MSTYAVGLDLGRTSAWCRVHLRSGELAVGHQRLGGETRGDVFHSFRRLLPAWLQGAHAVAYEEVHARWRGFSYIPGLTALLQVYCVERDLGYVGVNASELKLYATGHGGADKPAMVRAARRQLGLAPGAPDPTEDEADATMVAAWLLDHLAPHPTGP